jgi:hypothetical protein
MNPSSPNELDERAIGLFVRNQLNASLPQLATAASTRLFEARQLALRHQTSPVATLSAAGIGQLGRNWVEGKLRPMLMAGALIAALSAGNHLMTLQHIENQEDIDAALLSDDLPISAYLDNGFQSWLADSSRQ